MIDIREEIDDTPIGAYHRLLLLLVGLAVFFDGYDTFNASYVIHYVMKPWGMSPGQAGFMVSSGLIGFSTAALLQGKFSDRYGRRPVMLLFATPGLCPSRICGPVADILEELKSERGGDAAFIHMEIWNGNDRHNGIRPQVRAYGLPSEPWLFAIDRHGRVAARVEGAFSPDEAKAALDAAVRGAPRRRG